MTTPFPWRRRARPMLGTLVEVSIQARDEREFAASSDRAFQRIDDFQRAMSFHEADSDPRAIARARAGDRIALRPDTWHVLRAALAFEAESDGVFNCGVAGPLVRAGCLPAPEESAAEAPDATSALAALRLEEAPMLTVLRPVWIDLGGIAKGAAVDAALAAASADGDVPVIVNAGGDLAMRGAGEQPIEVTGPDGLRMQVGSLADGAVATSGPFGDEGRRDLVMPTGARARWADRSVTVIAPTCWVADALTKIVLALGPDAAPLLARHRAHAFSIAGGRLERVA